MALSDDEIVRWVATCALAVSAYYRRAPVPRVLVVVVPSDGDEVGDGRTLGAGGATIVVHVGRDATMAALERDWVMTHELTHLAFPTLPRKFAWLEEGLATYVEPILRARVGLIAPEDAWRGMVLGMPNGLPAAGDRGLDRTPTWGRTYWGGALFCLLADLKIRAATANTKSLDDALRGILDAGGNIAVRWSMERAIEEGDRATGVHVLRNLHATMGMDPFDVDLPSLFRQLGVVWRGHDLALLDTAPMATYRRAITWRDPTAPGMAFITIPKCEPGAAPSSACVSGTR